SGTFRLQGSLTHEKAYRDTCWLTQFMSLDDVAQVAKNALFLGINRPRLCCVYECFVRLAGSSSTNCRKSFLCTSACFRGCCQHVAQKTSTNPLLHWYLRGI